MFLQRFKYQNQQRVLPYQLPANPSPRLTEAIKRISVPQIKNHQKQQNYMNPRTFLIKNTQKAVKSVSTNKIRETQTQLNHQKSSHSNEISIKQARLASKYDLSNRESRTMAARHYRQRIWKSSDISNFIRAQQQLSFSRRTQNMRRSSNQSSQKVERYRDLLKQFGQETSAEKKQKIKKEWLNVSFKNNSSLKPSKNPQIQVTNIEFMDNGEKLQSSKVLLNRQKRRQLIRRSSFINYSSSNKRPNTTGGHYNQKAQQNFIQPW